MPSVPWDSRRYVIAGLCAAILLIVLTGAFWYFPQAAKANEGSMDPADVTETQQVTVDITVDSNNDGVINSFDDQPFKKDEDGVIVAINRAGDAQGALDIKPVKLTITNNPQTGTARLSSYGMPFGAVNVWLDPSASQPLILPKTWDLSTDTVPDTVYITGNTLGEGALMFSAGQSIDSVTFSVVNTPCWSPVGTYAYIWEPCPWSIGWAADTFCSQVQNYGWNVTLMRFYDLIGWDSDPGYCTMENFKSCQYGGLLCVCAHGNNTEASSEYFGSQAAADAWRGAEVGMSTVYSNDYSCYEVQVSSQWFADNWAAGLNDFRSITWWYCCNAYHDESGPVAMAGGRVKLGYDSSPNFFDNNSNLSLFFGRMTGNASGWDSTKRRAGDVYAGGGFLDSLKCNATDATLPPYHTTLQPAPLQSGPYSIDTDIGAGYVVFDT